MLKQLLNWARREAGLEETEPATIVSFNAATGGYVLNFRGAQVGPVWSTNGVRYKAGDVVQVLIARNRVKAIIP